MRRRCTTWSSRTAATCILVIKPDVDCVVNSGLGSIRGARMAENRRSDVTGTQQQRLTDPLVWRYGTWQPTTWDDALDLVARVTARFVDPNDEDELYVSMFDHGGSAGGYENTWGTGKLYFGSMKVKNCRIHNRPAYNSEVHSTRDMGVDELNYAYEDYTLTDTIMIVGANPMETQTNLFLNHMVPGMQGGAKVDHRRSAPHRHRQRLRRGGRRRERAAPPAELGHGPRALQRDLHLHRRPGLGGRRLHRRLDLSGRRGRGPGRSVPGSARQPSRPRCEAMPHLDGRGRRDLRRAGGRYHQGGRVDRQAPRRRQPPQGCYAPTRRASSGATTTTAPSAPW